MDKGIEEWEKEGMRGFCAPNSTYTRERQQGSMKHLAQDNTPARKERTVGVNVIPERKAIFEWVDGKHICTEQGRPPTVAYIDEIVKIQRKCVECHKYLADSKTNWRHKFQWGLPEGSIFRVCTGMKADSDELNNPPVKGYDLYADFVEDNRCQECMKERPDIYSY